MAPSTCASNPKGVQKIPGRKAAGKTSGKTSINLRLKTPSASKQTKALEEHLAAHAPAPTPSPTPSPKSVDKDLSLTINRPVRAVSPSPRKALTEDEVTKIALLSNAALVADLVDSVRGNYPAELVYQARMALLAFKDDDPEYIRLVEAQRELFGQKKGMTA